jgi:hypothetical protein
MKRILFVALILVAFTAGACKKSEEKQDQGTQEKQSTTNAPEAGKKKGKKGPIATGLEIYQGDKLVITIPPKDYEGLATTNVKVEGKDYKGILLTDLLKKYNVTGKSITLKGPAKEASLTWEQVSANPIHIYVAKKRLQIFRDSKALEEVKLPLVLIRVTAGDKPAEAAPTQAKGANKHTT